MLFSAKKERKKKHQQQKKERNDSTLLFQKKAGPGFEPQTISLITLFSMAKIAICSVDVLNNPGTFLSPFELEITFECVEHLPDDLEWSLVYVGSAESEDFDQVNEQANKGLKRIRRIS